MEHGNQEDDLPITEEIATPSQLQQQSSKAVVESPARSRWHANWWIVGLGVVVAVEAVVIVAQYFMR